mmetsp:Transcript_8816/g.32775  ORF Transcript_8816/g.32775 Transcript_8816/m.32775 type:complete len:356 (+) Transcript_8816:1385-2452(+)
MTKTSFNAIFCASRSQSASSSELPWSASASSMRRNGFLASTLSDSSSAILLACLRARANGESNLALTPCKIICVGLQRMLFHSLMEITASSARTLAVRCRCNSTDAPRTKSALDQDSSTALMFSCDKATARFASPQPCLIGHRIITRKSAGSATLGTPFVKSIVSHNACRVTSHAQNLSRNSTRKTKSNVRKPCVHDPSSSHATKTTSEIHRHAAFASFAEFIIIDAHRSESGTISRSTMDMRVSSSKDFIRELSARSVAFATDRDAPRRHIRHAVSAAASGASSAPSNTCLASAYSYITRVGYIGTTKRRPMPSNARNITPRVSRAAADVIPSLCSAPSHATNRAIAPRATKSI